MARIIARFALVTAVLTSTACDGPPGPAGPTGPRGQAGPTGITGIPGTPGAPGQSYAAGASSPSGSSYRPTAWFGCVAGLDLVNSSGLGTDGIKETVFDYRVTLFSNDDLDLNCSVTIGSAVSGTGGGYFPSIARAAEVGGCISTGEYPPLDGNAGYWDFQAPKSGPQATYKDAGNPMNGYVYRFTEAECNVFAVNDSGEWESTTLVAFAK